MDKDYEFSKLLEIYTFCNSLIDESDRQIVEPLSEEDERWLMEEIRSTFVHPTEKIKDNMAFISEYKSTEEKLNHCIFALKELQELTESFCFAKDFVKLGGLDMIDDLLMDQNVKLRCESSELLGNVNQNNLFCQMESINRNVVERLVDQIPRENDVQLVKKLIYALSCTVRGNQCAFERFIETGGFDLMLNLIQTSSESAVRCKIAFFIYCLLSEMDTNLIGVRRIEMCMNNFNNCIINLSSFSDIETEHLLGSLYCLMKMYPSIKLKKKFELMSLLKERQSCLVDFGVFEEIVFYTNEILSMLNDHLLVISSS